MKKKKAARRAQTTILSEPHAEVKERLLRMRNDELGKFKNGSRMICSGQLPDSMDAASLDSQDHVELVVRQHKSDLLKRIEEALLRIERGVYGNCSDCAEPIPEKRLVAMPFAKRCNTCQETYDEVEKRQAELAQRIRR